MSAKGLLRDAAARALEVAGLTDPARRARGRLSIATFHRVLPESERRAYPYPGLAVTPEELDAFLGYFVRHFDCGTLERQHARLERGEAAARPLLAVTFDDGQYDNYLHARPVLARHGVRASFFVPVQAVERGELLWHDRLGFAALALGRDPLAAVGEAKRLPLGERLRRVAALETEAGAQPPGFARLMTSREIGALAAEGHEIGSHSMTHCLMTECDDVRLAHELGESRRVLQAWSGQSVESFCYPNGNADARCAAAARAAGYRRAVTTAWGMNARGAEPLLLRRCDMDAERTRGARGSLATSLVAFRMSGWYPGLG